MVPLWFHFGYTAREPRHGNSDDQECAGPVGPPAEGPGNPPPQEPQPRGDRFPGGGGPGRPRGSRRPSGPSAHGPPETGPAPPHRPDAGRAQVARAPVIVADTNLV